jgi:hypothetical protein
MKWSTDSCELPANCKNVVPKTFGSSQQNFNFENEFQKIQTLKCGTFLIMTPRREVKGLFSLGGKHAIDVE